MKSALRHTRGPRGVSRRALLGGLGAALGLGGLKIRNARAASGVAERVIFFYFPDGVGGPSQDGAASEWHPTGSEYSFSLPTQTAALESWKDKCLFFSGLSMGGTDAGSHPGGAKKLLTAADYGNNQSIDQYLSNTVGYNSPWRHLYLGVQANYNNASGDKHIVYPTAGQTITPEDNPRQAFENLFGSAASTSTGGTTDTAGNAATTRRQLVIDTLLQDLNEIKTDLGTVEQTKLDLHMESLYELENRLTYSPTTDSASCETPAIDTSAFGDADLYEQSLFPDILKAQIDLTVLAMECGLTKVATIQGSYHTSELIMSRFPGTAMYNASSDMRSHQASHYGTSHSGELYTAFHLQRQWWVEQFIYLISQLAARPEGDGTMLDNSIVVLCTEICDGNVHYHDNMPFILAGGAGGAIQTGRYLNYSYARHGDLWVAVAQAMGADLWSFGDASSGPLSGVLS